MTGSAGPPTGKGRVGLIWAQAHDRVIGASGRLPWHLPEDLELFRATTMGGTVVMGRRTWDSLPARFRPLPGRTNVVLTADLSWAAEGAHRAGSVAEVLDHHASFWVIGGSAVYTALLPHADRLVVTDVDLDVAGDARAPVIGPEWQPLTRTPDRGWAASRAGGLRYAVTEYTRAGSGGAE